MQSRMPRDRATETRLAVPQRATTSQNGGYAFPERLGLVVVLSRVGLRHDLAWHIQRQSEGSNGRFGSLIDS